MQSLMLLIAGAVYFCIYLLHFSHVFYVFSEIYRFWFLLFGNENTEAKAAVSVYTINIAPGNPELILVTVPADWLETPIIIAEGGFYIFRTKRSWIFFHNACPAIILTLLFPININNKSFGTINFICNRFIWNQDIFLSFYLDY